MALDRLQSSTLTHAFTDLLTDLGDLVQKEMQLAKAEVTAGKYLDGRGGAGRIDRRFAGRGSGRVCDRKRRTGLALVVLAGGGAASAIAIFFYGRSLAEDDLMPRRSARQINQDIRTAKEQLT